MQNQKLGFEESLGREVVNSGRCIGCATCVVVCPFNCLEYQKEQPELVKACEKCGICPKVCPRYDWSQSSVEEFVFGKKRDAKEDYGIYRRTIVAQATDKKILQRCQDGGVVTSLLIHALQNDLIEGAAISGLSTDEPLHPMPIMATIPEEVLKHAGTRYAYSPNILALQEGVRQKKKSLAFVGTPCQIHAIRKIQMFPLKKYSNPLQFTIGLMCTESFTYDGLFEQHLQKNMEIPLKNVVKMNIKGKIQVYLKSGKVESIPLSEAKQYARASCHLCGDFSAELADISAGGLGLSGWTFVILRTRRGEEIFDDASKAGVLQVRSAEEEPFAQSLLVKLSKRKRRNAQEK
ncbi:MAG: Coenzyme F420 hydrogenase/dehydrogenase, beta subunit C-terminal domain [Candidatus Bathyarchaeota archaeon]|nr:MAG: Coenzyme F420 hydrogenase/dehydrogenase, beta subunit C-terminal domain [Candidatus Bathyarchaeota archaeon]